MVVVAQPWCSSGGEESAGLAWVSRPLGLLPIFKLGWVVMPTNGSKVDIVIALMVRNYINPMWKMYVTTESSIQ